MLAPVHGILKINNGAQPCEKAKTLPFNLDFSQAVSWDIDLSAQFQNGQFTTFQTIYALNMSETEPLIIISGGTNQETSIPPGFAAYLPIVINDPPKLNIACSDAGNTNQNVQLLNIYMPPVVWWGGQGASPFDEVDISNSDGTLTLNPNPITNTGTVSLNLAHANIWTAIQTDSGLTTTMPGWYAELNTDTTARARFGLNGADIPSIAFGSGAAARDTAIQRDGVATFRFGLADVAAPVGQTFNVQNVLTGTANAAGNNLTINASIGTGTGIGGAIIFQCAPSGVAGSAQNALTPALTISGGGTVVVPGQTSLGNLNVTLNTIPTNGIYMPAASTLAVAVGGLSRITVTTSTMTVAPDILGNVATSYRCVNNAPTGTAPVFVPNRTSLTSGIGAQAAGNVSVIASGVEVVRATTNGELLLISSTVAALPAAATAGRGCRAFVTDGLGPVFAAAVVGGGAVFTPVYSDGAAWRCG